MIVFGKTAVLTYQEIGEQSDVPFERHYDYVVVLFRDRVELRMHEKISSIKYIIHTETIPGTPNFHSFVEVFGRQLELDPVDIRKAIRMGIKANTSHS